MIELDELSRVNGASLESLDGHAVQSAMTRIDEFVLKHRGTLLEQQLLESSFNYNQTQTVYGIGEVQLERLVRDEIMRATYDQAVINGQVLDLLAKYPPILRTFNYSALEAVAADLTDDSHLVHIGSGRLPETLIGVHRATGVDKPNLKLTGVDMDSSAIDDSMKLLEAIGLQNRIDLVLANGSEHDYSQYSHMLVAVLVRPEIDTVAQICQTARTDAPVTVMLRRVQGLGKLVYDDVDSKSLEILVKNGFVQTDLVKGHAIVETAVFKRNS